jgi:hypothetical protein
VQNQKRHQEPWQPNNPPMSSSVDVGAPQHSRLLTISKPRIQMCRCSQHMDLHGSFFMKLIGLWISDGRFFENDVSRQSAAQ